LVLLCISGIGDVIVLAMILLDFRISSFFSLAPLQLKLLSLFLSCQVLLFVPFNFYCAYYLYQSLRAAFMSLTFEPVRTSQRRSPGASLCDCQQITMTNLNSLRPHLCMPPPPARPAPHADQIGTADAAPSLPIESYPITTPHALPPAPAAPLRIAPDVDKILKQASACIGTQSCRELQFLSLSNPFSDSSSVPGAICRSGERAGFVAIASDTDGCFLIPPCPIIRSVRHNLADLSDRRLVDFPSTAKCYGFIPIPDGVIQITFFKVVVDGEVAISAC
ncbi:hypothetical protein BVRB_020760, partial [Beta vulgaris subsp. vulgaris]